MLKESDHKEFLSLAYEQCNEYAREQPRARDQVILFYTAICAFYLSQAGSMTDFMFLCLSFAMVILGFACSLIVISFRSWIIQYGNAAEVIGKLLITQQRFSTLDDIRAFIKCNYFSNQKPFFLRMGNILVIVFLFVTLAPFAAICDHLIKKCSDTFFIGLCVLCAALYFLSLVSLAYHEIKKADSMGDKTWIIRFQNNIK